MDCKMLSLKREVSEGDPDESAFLFQMDKKDNLERFGYF